MKRWFALAALALLAACATATPTTATHFTPPPPGSRILVMTPDIQLSLLTAVGMQEPREDWSHAARDNIAASIGAQIEAKGHTTSALDPNAAMEGQTGQMIRLHEVVGGAIIQNRYFPAMAPPTRKNNNDWTLGPGVQSLGATYEADYALFVVGNGSYASAGRVAAMIGFAALGVGIPLGGQVAFASLVDLRTGDVIWFNMVQAGASQDMREAPGAEALTTTLLQGAPL